MGTNQLEIERHRRDTHLTLRLAGNLFASALPGLARIVDEEEAAGITSLEFDMNRVEHLDSRGIGALVGWFRHFALRSVEFRLRNVHGNVLSTLQISNLLSLFEIASDENETPAARIRRQREALLRSHSYARQIVEALGEGMIGLNPEGQILFLNPAAEDLLGWSEAELVGTPFNRVRAGAAGETAPDGSCTETRAALGQIGPQRERALYVRKSGAAIPVEVQSIPIHDGGRCTGAVVGFNDMTDRDAAENAVRQSAERFGVLIRNALDIVAVIGADARIQYVSPSLEGALGHRPADLIGRSPQEYLHPDDLPAVLETIRAGIAEPEVTRRVEYRFRHVNGAWRVMEAVARNMFADPSVGGFVVNARDITERKAAEENLQREKAFADTAINSLPGVFYLIDDEFRFRRWNHNFEKMTGNTAEEFARLGPLDLFEGEDKTHIAERMRQVFEQGEAWAEASIVSRTGARTPHFFTGLRFVSEGRNYLVGMGLDISERKRAEEERRQLEAQVRHAQKLESLGVLAGGIAHDFNNLLVGILGNAGLATSQLPEGSPVRSTLFNIEKAAMRAADLTRQMLAYSGRGRFVVECLNLSALVEEMGTLVDASISRRITLTHDFAPDLPPIEADATQLRQIIMNLIINASDAIGDRDGVIRVSTGLAHCTSADLIGSGFDDDLPEGPYVFLEVSDTGCGMDADTIEKIFDPFYTTKFTGRGLGLAAVLGIVRGHHGSIRVESTPGQGSTFRILFPKYQGEESVKDSKPSVDQAWKAKGLALVVDDEEIVRDLSCAVLEAAGFDWIAAVDGTEALDIYRKRGSEIAFILMDMMMPGLTGDEAASEIHKIDPKARIILSSGYSEQEISERVAGRGIAGFMQKPYLPDQLVARVREVLARE